VNIERLRQSRTAIPGASSGETKGTPFLTGDQISNLTGHRTGW